MNPWQKILLAWDFHPSVVVGCFLLLIAYLVAVHGRMDRYMFRFSLGVAILFFALVSPLDTLGDEDLFSAHMAQHVLIQMLAPLFFVLGVPPDMARTITRWPPAAITEKILRQPAVAWFLGVGTLWLWHFPALYNATLANENIHIFEHLTFVVTGTIFWWPVFAPLEYSRMSLPGSLLYLSLGGIANAILGIIFTISSTAFYASYNHPKDELGVLATIRNSWGLTQIADQQLGGSIMWIGMSFIVFLVILVMVTQWFQENETD